jgi:ferritin-like metal-binding protein YciE
MTHEEAVKILNQTFRNIVTDVHYSANDIDKALSMAIEALSTPELPSELEEAAKTYSEQVSNGHHFRDLECGFIAGAEWMKEQEKI